MKDLTIIFPCYNEADNLPLLVNELKRIKKNSNLSLEFILVNNGSTDHTSKVIKIFNKESIFKVINLKKNSGYGGGILEGLKIAKGKIISWTHADLQCPPSDVIKIYRKYKKDLIKNSIIAKGLRTNRRFLDLVFTRCMSILCFFVLGIYFRDINGQPKLFNNNLKKKVIKNGPKDFSLDLFLLYYANLNGQKISYFKTSFNNRLRGEPKGGGNLIGKLKLSFNTLMYIFKLKKKYENNNT